MFCGKFDTGGHFLNKRGSKFVVIHPNFALSIFIRQITGKKKTGCVERSEKREVAFRISSRVSFPGCCPLKRLVFVAGIEIVVPDLLLYITANH